MGILYLVATPIGNLEDISLRALRVLKESSLIAAEDTRQTHKLLERYTIQARSISYHEHNKLSRLDEVLHALESGDVALVSDAGTPGLNDPGYELVKAALDAGHTVSPVPGPSAPVAALVSSGLPTDQFLFLGYLPRRSAERRQLLQSVSELSYTLLFLEAPHRMLDSLADIRAVLGDRPIAAARELTKMHEEILRGTVSSVEAHFRLEEPRGEFTLVVGGALRENLKWDPERLRNALRAAENADDPPAILADRLAKASGWRKKDVYRAILDLKAED